ncbi:hypothetical protein ACIOC2_37250, partial [Streptomyces sp. NPDC088337]|uniref:hypothetical protein n=1 Tax=unclassified Streptomyces TaxID=2593676 RepID=UPI00382FCC3E
ETPPPGTITSQPLPTTNRIPDMKITIYSWSTIAPRSPHAGINSILHTTHRQNYLVPPRRHRSFPLAEFLV